MAGRRGVADARRPLFVQGLNLRLTNAYMAFSLPPKCQHQTFDMYGRILAAELGYSVYYT